MSDVADILARMCPYCNDLTNDEVMFDIDARVHRDGVAFSGCEASERNPTWHYSVGLELSFDHPELLVVCCASEAARRILLDLTDQVRNGARLDQLAIASTVLGDAELRRIHPAQVDAGALATCSNYYDGIRFDRPLRAIQVVADDFCCDGHQMSYWDLRAEIPLLNSPVPPPRSQRRANQRRRSR